MADLPTLPAPDAVDIMEKSDETIDWLRNNIAVGFTAQRGPAWWADTVRTKTGEWAGIPDGSHFDGPVPIETVRRILDIKLVKGTVHVTYEDADGNRQVAADPDTSPIVNAETGQIFSYPTSKYKIHPYFETLHGFIERIQYDESVAVGSVGLLKKGGQAFLQAVLPEHYEVAGYGYVPYLTAVTSADTSRATSYLTGFDGTVCDNTVSMALTKALKMLKIRHTLNSGAKVQDARERLGIQLQRVGDDIDIGIQLQRVGDDIGQAIDNLVKVDVSDKEFEAWLDLAVPMPEPKETKTGGPGRAYTMAENKRDEMIRLWDKDPKVHPWSGTAFGILQLDNTYRTWNQIVRNADGGRIERNYANMADGSMAAADAKALGLLAEVKDKTLTFA